MKSRVRANARARVEERESVIEFPANIADDDGDDGDDGDARRQRVHVYGATSTSLMWVERVGFCVRASV